MPYKIAPLILSPGKKANTTCDIYIAQPDAHRESLAGKLFIIAEIELAKISSLKIINFLASTLNHNYYQNEKILLMEKMPDLTVEHIFESALAKTNAGFSEFIRNEKIKIKMSSLHITVGTIHENTLYFSTMGKNKVLFIHKNNQTDKNTLNSNKTAAKYSLSDITKQSASAAGTAERKTRLFGYVVSGQIPEKGHFLIANEALPEYISNKQLIQILTTLPPLSAVEQIKNILSRINAYVSFLGLIIKSTSYEKITAEPDSSRPTTNDSITTLLQTEDATENLLAPSGIINFKKWLGFLSKQKSDQIAKKPGGKLLLKDKIFVKKKTYLAINKISPILKNILSYLANAIIYLAKLIISRKKLTAALNRTADKLKQSIGKITLALARLNKKRKALLVLAAVLILFFIGNLYYLQKKNTKLEDDNKYAELTALIERKQNQAEANLLYSNENGAGKLFSEIEALLKNFPQETEAQKQKLIEFQNKFTAQLEKIRHVAKIDNFEILANLNSLTAQADPDNIIFIKETNKIYSADTGQQTIYILDITNNLITSVADLGKDLNNLRHGALANASTIYYYNNDNIAALDASRDEFTYLPINIPAGAIQSIKTYNEKIYALNSDTSQIYRYNRSGSNLSKPYSWIQTPLDLSGAVDMSIDGHIYVLKNNGEVIKLLRGKKIDFNLEKIEPALDRADKIYVSPEQKYIYILDHAGKRLIIFDKTGQFILQYQSPRFDDVKDFAIDEINKKIYLLNANMIINFAAAHFEE